MKKGLLGIITWSLTLIAALSWVVAPVRAQSVDEKIKALEQELSSLKSQQIELKKEATAAAAALPTFSYRPGNGVNIEAADKSWGIRFSMETDMRMLFESGQDQVGRTNGEVMLRRFRPYIFYCIDNCLYEIEIAWDMDGFGTGNAKDSTGTNVGSIMQRGVVHFHLENLNPFLPTVDIGGDVSTSFSTWFCNVDQRQQAVNGCSRLRIQDNGNAARQTLFDTGANSIGEGLVTLISPGITWEVGPYRLRAMGTFMSAGGSVALRGKKRANNFLIGHDLFVWSPKGFLTGSANTPGSILVGTHFERNDVSCDTPRCGPINGGQFHRGTYLVREWDLWYFLAPRMSIGGGVWWYDASNSHHDCTKKPRDK